MPRIHYARASRLTLLIWSLLLLALAGAAIPLLALFVLATVLSAIWVGLPFLLALTPLIRYLADTQRRVLGQFLPHGPIPSPYRPMPSTTFTVRIRTILTEPATWRDLAWLALNATLGAATIALPGLLVAHATHDILFTWTWHLDPHWFGLRVTDQTTANLIALTAVPALVTFWLLTPLIVSGYAHLNQWLLAPTEKARLTARVAHLATSRADTVDAQASEVRRIERDLHDGAQARLVALGMNLGMAEEMLANNPAQAQQLLTEARESTRQALTELRDLVRGIHPPVLVERGLEGAIRALAVSQDLPITVDIDLPGRPPDPVESAAYFATAEILTNTAKHAHAQHAWVRINHGQNRMVLLVGDNGHGGATIDNGTGLAGIQRRLAAFDGTMTILSPKGGPTIITMELPCALSSPRTSHSSATD